MVRGPTMILRMDACLLRIAVNSDWSFGDYEHEGTRKENGQILSSGRVVEDLTLTAAPRNPMMCTQPSMLTAVSDLRIVPAPPTSMTWSAPAPLVYRAAQ